MRDGSDAVADWPMLNALVNTACGRVAGCRSTTAAASAWASRSTPARCSSPTGRPRRPSGSARVLTADPGMGVVRHVDAGYPEAIEAAAAARRADPDARRRAVSAALSIERARRSCCARPRTGCRTCATTARPAARSSRARVAARRRGDRRLEADAGADGADRRVRLRGRPGASSTATRTSRSPAGARRSTRRRSTGRPVRGDRARRRRDPRPRRGRSPQASDERGARAGRGRWRAEMLAHGTTTFECKSGYGLSRGGRAARACGWRPRSRGRVPQRTPSTGAARPRRAGRATTPTAGWTRSSGCSRTCSRRRDVERARHLRRVGRVLQRRTSRGWASWRPSTGSTCARTSSSSAPTARCRSRWRPARARSTTSPACIRDDVAPLAASECAAVLLPGAEFIGARADRARRARWPTPARSACWPPTQPGHLAGRVAAA